MISLVFSNGAVTGRSSRNWRGKNGKDVTYCALHVTDKITGQAVTLDCNQNAHDKSLDLLFVEGAVVLPCEFRTYQGRSIYTVIDIAVTPAKSSKS